MLKGDWGTKRGKMILIFHGDTIAKCTEEQGTVKASDRQEILTVLTLTERPAVVKTVLDNSKKIVGGTEKCYLETRDVTLPFKIKVDISTT